MRGEEEEEEGEKKEENGAEGTKKRGRRKSGEDFGNVIIFGKVKKQSSELKEEILSLGDRRERYIKCEIERRGESKKEDLGVKESRS